MLQLCHLLLPPYRFGIDNGEETMGGNIETRHYNNCISVQKCILATIS